MHHCHNYLYMKQHHEYGTRDHEPAFLQLVLTLVFFYCVLVNPLSRNRKERIHPGGVALVASFFVVSLVVDTLLYFTSSESPKKILKFS